MTDDGRCRQCGEVLHEGAVRCHACAIHQDPWWSRTGTWIGAMGLLVAVIVGILVWDNWRTDREAEEDVDKYVCALIGGADCE